MEGNEIEKDIHSCSPLVLNNNESAEQKLMVTETKTKAKHTAYNPPQL